MPLFQLRRLKEAASRSKMDESQVNSPTGVGKIIMVGNETVPLEKAKALSSTWTALPCRLRTISSSNLFGRVELSWIVKMGLDLWRMQTMHKESPSEFSPVIWVLPAFVGVAK